MFGSFAGLGEALPGSVLIKTEAYGRKWIVFVWFSISNWVEYGSVPVERANRLETFEKTIRKLHLVSKKHLKTANLPKSSICGVFGACRWLG